MLVCLFSIPALAEEQPKPHPTTLDDTDKLALQTYCNTVANMITMVHNPDDKQNVAHCIGNIATGLINFVVQAIANNKKQIIQYKELDAQIKNLIAQHLSHKSANHKADFSDATEEINALEAQEQAAPIAHLTENIHALFATINSIVNNLYSLAQNQQNAQKISTEINSLLEKTVRIAVETMKNQYLHGHATEQDFATYLESLEDLQEKIKHTIVTNALHLRQE